MKEKKRQITTDRLAGVLKQVKTEQELQTYMAQYGETFYGSFHAYFNDYLAEHGLTVPEVTRRSNISPNYVYNILNGNRKPGRDKVIALCVGAGMGYAELNRALEIAGLGVLYPKDERDARIIIAVNRGVKSVVELNLLLEQAGVALLQ